MKIAIFFVFFGFFFGMSAAGFDGGSNNLVADDEGSSKKVDEKTEAGKNDDVGKNVKTEMDRSWFGDGPYSCPPGNDLYWWNKLFSTSPTYEVVYDYTSIVDVGSPCRDSKGELDRDIEEKVGHEVRKNSKENFDKVKKAADELNAASSAYIAARDSLSFAEAELSKLRERLNDANNNDVVVDDRGDLIKKIVDKTSNIAELNAKYVEAEKAQSRAIDEYRVSSQVASLMQDKIGASNEPEGVRVGTKYIPRCSVFRFVSEPEPSDSANTNLSDSVLIDLAYIPKVTGQDGLRTVDSSNVYRVCDFGKNSAAFDRDGGMTWGTLVVPFKYYMNSDEFAGNATVGPYIGWAGSRAQLLVGVGYGKIGLGKASDVPGGEPTTENVDAISYAIGVTYAVSASVDLGLFFGKDKFGRSSRSLVEYQDETWFSIGIGYSFTERGKIQK